MTDETPVPKPTPWLEYLKSYGLLGYALAAVLGYLQYTGQLTPEHIEKGKEVLQEVQGDKHKPQQLVETEVTVPEEKVGGMTPEQWAELIQKIVDALPKPAPQPVPPVPVPEPEPTPAPKPAPRPTPQPSPSALKIVIRDESGADLIENNVEPGHLFQVTSGIEGKVGWTVSKHGDVRLLVLPNNLGYAFSLQGDSFVEFFLTDSDLKSVSTRIECNQGPQPPPDIVPVPVPTPPGPEPKPEPPKPITVVPHVSLVVVADVSHPTPQVSIVLNATDVWNSFRAAGNDWKFYDNDSTETAAMTAKADATGNPLPVLIVYDKDTKAKLAVVPLPKTVAELKQVVSDYTEVK